MTQYAPGVRLENLMHLPAACTGVALLRWNTALEPKVAAPQLALADTLRAPLLLASPLD
jgi:hypothetical protein